MRRLASVVVLMASFMGARSARASAPAPPPEMWDPVPDASAEATARPHESSTEPEAHKVSGLNWSGVEPAYVAQANALPPEERFRPRWRFYGWENMVVGELGAALTGVGILVGSPRVYVPGLFVYVTGSPVIHVFEGTSAKVVGSIALAVGVPLTGAGVGALVATEVHHNPTYWAVAGGAMGMVAAPLLDGLLLGWRHDKKPHRPGHASAAPLLRCDASPDGRSGGFVVGAQGKF